MRMLTVAEDAPAAFSGIVGWFPGRIGAVGSGQVEARRWYSMAVWHRAMLPICRQTGVDGLADDAA